MHGRCQSITFLNCAILAVAMVVGSHTSKASTPPSGLSYRSPQFYSPGTPINPLAPSVNGTVTDYSVSPLLPAGLTLNAASGKITGTPKTLQPLAGYAITASNDAGSTAFTLSIAVVTVNVSPWKISRLVAAGTPITVALSVTPVDFAFSGTFAAKASDAAGVFLPTASVTPSHSGYSVDLTVSPTIAPGHYTGHVTLELCANSGCTAFQRIPKVAIPFDVDIISSTSTWPGNHLTSLVPWTGVPDWTTFQGNAGHTGYVPVTINPNNFSTRWQGPTVSASAIYYPNLYTLTTANGQFFIASGTPYSTEKPTLYARREFDGSLIWQYDFSSLPFPSVNPPSVANGVVYIAAGQQSSTYMFAFKAADGTLVFKSPMSSQWENYLAPTVGAKGVYTNAGTYGGLFAFNFSGQQLFFGWLPQTSLWTPAVDAQHVYTYTDNGLDVFDPGTGALQESIADPTFTNYVYEIGGSPVLGAPGSVFAADYANSVLNGGGIGNTLLRFDLAANSIAWKVAGDYPSTPAYHAGVLYAANNNPLRLEARGEATGALLWWWTPPQAGDTNFDSEVLLTQNMAFVSTNLATYGIDLVTHKTVWSYPLAGRLALSRNGILYIEGGDPVTAINVK